MNIEQSQGKQLQAETNCAETKVQGTAYKQFNAKKNKYKYECRYLCPKKNKISEVVVSDDK